MVETFLAENNFREALVTIDRIYEKFELTSEQADEWTRERVEELTGLRVYVRWLQQLAEKEGSIYKLPESEIEYLIKFVETHSGRGKVFANNILCGLYGICIEEQKSRNAEMQKSRRAEKQKGRRAEGQKSRRAEKQKSRKAEEQKGRRAEGQKSRRGEKQKCRRGEKQKSRKGKAMVRGLICVNL